MKNFKSILKPMAFVMSCSILFMGCSKYETILSGDEGKANMSTQEVITFEAVNEVAQEAARGNYTGEDLFTSIFFAYGDFAREIDLYSDQVEIMNDLDSTKIAINDNRFLQLTNDIKQIDSNFFDNFKVGITSGNHNEVSNAIQNAFSFMSDYYIQLFPEYADMAAVMEEDVQNGVVDIQDPNGYDDYLSSIETRYNNGEFDGLLQDNVLVGVPCSWYVVCVLYFALAVHNTVVVTINVYLAVNFWGPDLDHPSFESQWDKDLLSLDILVHEIAVHPF